MKNICLGIIGCGIVTEVKSGPAFRKPSIRSSSLSCREWRKPVYGLVLGVDEFAIMKGHRYNKGTHDLKGGTMLDLLPGRKLDELWTYAEQQPKFLQNSASITAARSRW